MTKYRFIQENKINGEVFYSTEKESPLGQWTYVPDSSTSKHGQGKAIFDRICGGVAAGRITLETKEV